MSDEQPVPKPINPHFENPCELCNAEEGRHDVTIISRLVKVGMETMYIMRLGSACYCEWILDRMPKSATRVSA